MATRNFRELVVLAKDSWSEEADVVYDAAAASYQAEIAARHNLEARPRRRFEANGEDLQ